MPSARTTPLTAKSVALAGFGLAGVALGSALTLTLNTLTTEKIDFVQDGTQTGAVLQVDGVAQFQALTVSCTGTGGNVKVSGGAKYDTCITASPLSTTGAIKEVSLAISASPAAVGFDCGFVKGFVSGTGTSFTNLGNFTSATGSIFRFGTGSLRWNSADYIKCGTLTNPTSSFSAKLRVELYDDTSE